MKFLKFILSIFLVAFLCSCSKEIDVEPNFSTQYTVSCGETKGTLIGDYLILTEPETLDSMEFFVSEGITYVMYMDITKTSDEYPQIMDFEGAKIVNLMSKIKDVSEFSPIKNSENLEFNLIIDGKNIEILTDQTGGILHIEADYISIDFLKDEI